MMAFHWMETMNMRYRLTSMAILVAGIIFILGAIGFCVAAGFLWLSTRMESDAAALIVAGVLFVVGGVIMAFALERNNHRPSSSSDSLKSPETDIEMISDHMMRSALAEATETPFKAAFAAVALGVIVGLLRSQKTP